MTEFGLLLKQARERRGLSLRQIAAATKISSAALDALERGDFSRLPGGIFSRAFVRAYAVEVGLDPDETVRQYTELSDAAAQNAASDVRTAEITDDDRAFLERQRQAGIWLRVIATILLVGITAVVAWWRVSVARRQTVAAVAPVTATPPPVAPPPARPVAAPSVDSVGTAHALTIELHANASCWVQVVADGTTALERILTAGEREVILAENEVALQFGNAGAISWSINGAAAKPLGKPGDVRRATVTPGTIAQFVLGR